MNRRGFLQSILVAAAAPAIVRADSLMRIIPIETTLIRLEDTGDVLYGNDLWAYIQMIGGGTSAREASMKVWPAQKNYVIRLP